MKVDTIVTLDGNERYYLVDKTEQDGKTVSYTHLTLPTICSV